jgi:hypothetical protein
VPSFRFSRPSPAMAVAVCALVVAMSGTAFATSYVITSTQQIAPRVLKKLRGHRGPRGVRGFRGVAGTTGLRGLQGLTGLSGQNGQNGQDGKPGPGIRWALVKGTDATIIAQSGGITAARQSTGRYYVEFGSSVAGHALSTVVHAPTGSNATISSLTPCGGPTLVTGLDPPDLSHCGFHNTSSTVEVNVALLSSGTVSDQDFYIELFA